MLSNDDSFALFDHKPMCLAKKFWGHKKILQNERAYQTIWPLQYEDDGCSLTFQDDGINKAVSYLRYFRKFYDEVEFFHAAVRGIIFDAFLKAMDSDNGISHTLEFSCWCDGGKYILDIFRQHRHFIVVAPKGHFIPNVWHKINTFPHEKFECLQLKRIKTPMHLVNTIGYLSRRKSMCEITFDRNYTMQRDNLNHFYIFKELPKNFNLILATQWETGLLELVQQKLDQEKKLSSSGVLIDGQWHIKVKDVPDIVSNVILPVAYHFKPSDDGPTEYFIHLTEERKMYFEKYEYTNLENWIKLQVKGGNLFYRAIADEYFMPKQQMFLSHVQSCIDLETKPLKAKILELNSKIKVLKDENMRLEESLEGLEYYLYHKLSIKDN